jgi:6-pyruvoyltetrahydropterin/6-carboxytetrahydropterin synthase
MKVRITKEFYFEMAHALFEHDGPCRNIHGHSYKLEITIKGEADNLNNGPKAGMVMDFSDLKKIVNEEIIKEFDHALVLSKNVPDVLLNSLKDNKLIICDFQPTCENLVSFFAEKLKKRMPSGVELCNLLLHETNTSYAGWYAEDNLFKNE